MLVSYHELRGLSPAKARDIVVKVLKQNQGNVARTAAILGICRRTVRRARDGALHDRSRRPACSPRKTPLTFEKLIITEAKRTHFRYRRLAAYLHRKFSLSFSEHTIKAILKRNRVARVTRKSASGERRHLYDYESLTPFAEYQLDTKHLLDQHALPAGVYDHMYQKGLPRFEWHLMEVATRTRFTAYSYELSAAFGLLFVILALSWLRAHNVRASIRIRCDNGYEFCSGSEKKLADWNRKLEPFRAVLDPIPPGAKHLNGLVENAHRADDEYFLMIHAERCEHTYRFLAKAQAWQDTWNFYKPSFGIAMGGRTPSEKLKATKSMIHWHVLLFPVMLLEDVMKRVGLPQQLLHAYASGTYVHTTCQFLQTSLLPIAIKKAPRSALDNGPLLN